MDAPLKQRIQNDLKEAMRANDECRKTVVRLIMASIRNAEVDARTDGRGGTLSDEDILALIGKEIKQHEESLSEARGANREDLVIQQTAELEILRSYLPKQMSREEIIVLAQQVIAEVHAILYEGRKPEEVVDLFMARSAKPERA